MEKDKILIVDDEEVNRIILKNIFEEQYEVLEAANGEEALALIDEYAQSLVVIFLDLMMPVLNGFGVLEYMSEKEYMNRIPVILITGDATAESQEKGYDYGVSDIIHKPFAPRVVMRRTRNIIDLYASRREMEKQLEERTRKLRESEEKLRNSNEFLVNALSSVVEFRSLESGEHIRRVKFFTRIMLKYLIKYFPEYQLTDEDAELIIRASSLHDLGKIAIPDAILLKPGKLTPAEYEIMKQHSVYGSELLERFKQDDNQFYRYCYEICRHHHERYDGKGYPDGLKGEEIPISAQVVSLVDVYDALVSKRVYKEPYTNELAVQMIKNGECGVFSPKIMECFDLAKEDFFCVVDVLDTCNFI
ncbi:MAG: response regulator [Lachnospiraceae bacterium]|nr:response regulator [Lachnospiraceae bacterium]